MGSLTSVACFDCRSGWLGVAKVSCILRHRGVQLRLANSWARPAILVAGEGRGGMFLFLLFLHFHSCSSFFHVPLFHLLYYLFSFLPFSGRRHKMTHKGSRVVKPQLNQFDCRSRGQKFESHLSLITSWRWFIKAFLQPFSPFRYFRKSVSRLTDKLDMTFTELTGP